MNINFRVLSTGSGGEPGARKRFEDLIVDLVYLIHPTVRTVEANPGDWGIDAFIGQLEDTVAIWQAKYFINGVGEAQKGEIRTAFAAALKAAEGNGYEVERWTLCIPCSMDGPTTKWWDGWKARKTRETGVSIDLWDETQLRARIRSQEARSIYEDYFEPTAAGATTRAVSELSDPTAYNEAIFVKQLQEAGVCGEEELYAAKRAFFNAELLVTDVRNRQAAHQEDALVSVRSENHGIWAVDFAAAKEQQTGNQLPGLHGWVMTHLREHHYQVPAAPLRLNVIHRWGVMHQLVEEVQAGWVRNFKEVADSGG